MNLENLVFDSVEPQRLGRFWEAVLGAERLTDEPDGFETRLTVEGGPVLDLCFQRVSEPPTDQPRLHLDLSGRSSQDEEVARLLGRGARRLDIGQRDVPWVVLADPEGNPCCVMEERAVYHDSGPIAALPLDSADPDRDGGFWSWLTGWTDVVGVAPRSLRHPSLRGPLLELCPEPAPKGRPRTACTSTSGSSPARTLTASRHASPSWAAASSIRSGASLLGVSTKTRPAMTSASFRRAREAPGRDTVRGRCRGAAPARAPEPRHVAMAQWCVAQRLEREALVAGSVRTRSVTWRVVAAHRAVGR